MGKASSETRVPHYLPKRSIQQFVVFPLHPFMPGNTLHQPQGITKPYKKHACRLEYVLGRSQQIQPFNDRTLREQLVAFTVPFFIKLFNE